MVRYRFKPSPNPQIKQGPVFKPTPVVKPVLIEEDKPVETRFENGKKIEVYKFRL